ncbi:hypothetical protein H7K45_05665 [Mycobacterium yunnanensis]|uniref:Uncharacterized protein n=1 Tax=Mycobacterium yunnanensis TaxID=368477 RepID=A0A9X3BRY5_9MYCO|nr:hypothetical protein [Mycobacterium yunnanensis]MCV7420019.1 hypothetical protein [Mycobacterium yunnanensis]
MGRHSRSTHSPRHAAADGTGAAILVGRVGALAVALGIGAAVAGGTAVAYADTTSGDGAAAGSRPASSSTTAADTASAGGREAEGPAHSPGPDTGAPGPTSPKPSKHSSPVSVVGATKVTATGNDAVATASDEPSTTTTAPHATGRVNGADDGSQSVTTSAESAPATTTVTGSAPVAKASSSTRTGDAPVAPAPVALGALQLIRRETETVGLAKPAAAVTELVTPVTSVDAPQAAVVAAPSPTDVAHTPYGDVGTWLLAPNGQIANYGGVPHDAKTVLEPVNVIILDPSSTSTAESLARLDAAMTRAGFPAQPIHSTGFQGVIDGTTYGQQPAGFLQAFSDDFFLFPNDHGRVFGPAPATTGTGYVYTGAFSTEQLNPANPFTHEYVSSTMARDELARRLVASGAATVVGVVPLGNAYDDGSFTTGDHDGYAVVLQLTPGVVAVLPTGGVLGAACGHVDDLPGPVARQFATGLCVFAASVSNALGLRSII